MFSEGQAASLLPADMQMHLLKLCERELEELLREFDVAPGRIVFSDLGAAAEMLILADGIDAAKPMLRRLGMACASWLQSGLFEDLLMGRAELAYHVALMTCLARTSDISTADVEGVCRLIEGRLVARNEMPMLRQQLIKAYFSACRIEADYGPSAQRDLARIMDRRVLRPRSDEQDLLSLIMCAQLLQVNQREYTAAPRTFPLVMLVQAIRAGNANWIPPLALLCKRFFGIPRELAGAADRTMHTLAAECRGLLPCPSADVLDSDYVQRNERGLRLRSTIALALSLSA
jgi:hypothetical protein